MAGSGFTHGKQAFHVGLPPAVDANAAVVMLGAEGDLQRLGIQIHTLITVKIDGIAASAASVIAMAGTKVLVSPVSMMMIHNPMTVAMGDTAEMQKAIEMLGSVKDSIINAYEIKTGLSRTRLSHLMDAETWMDAGKAVELGFADEVLKRSEVPEDMETPAVSMLYSKAAVVNSLMDKIAAKCKTNPKKTEDPKPQGRSVDSLYERLNLMKF